MKAVIDQAGAWVNRLEYNDSPLLFPKKTFTLPDGGQKVRGGCHVCVPNFGPGGNSDQAQHGIARNSQWKVVAQTASSIELSLHIGVGLYAGLNLRLSYVISADALSMALQLENTSDESMHLAPAFHPYFYSQPNAFSVADKRYDTSDCSDSLQIQLQNVVEVRVNERSLILEMVNLSHGVLWTDSLDSYICIEPTQSGFSFEEDRLQDMVVLQPHDNWACTFKISHTIS